MDTIEKIETYIEKMDEAKMTRPKNKGPYILGDTLSDKGKIIQSRLGTTKPRIMAVWNGKPKRKPKKGEWYVSGAPGFERAYQAPNDLSTEYFIVDLKKVKRKQEVNFFPI